MALTRVCPFCLEPKAECVCPDIDEPAAPAAHAPGEDEAANHADGLQAMASGLTVKRTAAVGARAVAERKLALLRAAVRLVLDDEESAEGGWGPDVTMVTVLREAMEASS